MLSKHAVRLLVGINFCFWVNSFVRDKTALNPNSQMGPNKNISDWIQCALNSSSGALYYNSKKFIIPAYVEFIMLCITLLKEIMSMTSSEHEPNKQINDCNSSDDSSTDEDTPILPRLDQDVNRSTKQSRCVPVAMVISVLLSVPNIILHIVHDLFSDESLELHVVAYETSLKSVMILATILAFYFTERIMTPPTLRVWEYSTRDMLFLASVLAIFSNYCFAVMAACLSDNETSKLILVADCINLIQVYFQSVFLLHVSRCVRNVSYEKCTCFVCICMFLAVSNFGCWIVDSFIIGQALTRFKHIQMKILQPTVWHVLYEIFGPLTMYYRFASLFAFHTLFMRFSAR